MKDEAIARETDRPQAAAARGWWRRLLDRPARHARRTRAHGLYVTLVGQARRTVFYRDLGVPDSADGRFEMIGLHAILAMRHLREHGPEGQALAQELFDLMFKDMDRGLREMGVGDLSVGKHVKHLAKTFLARARMLDPMIAAGDVAPMLPVLERNVYHGAPVPDASQVQALARYVLAQDQAFAALPAEAWHGAQLAFAPDPRAASA